MQIGVVFPQTEFGDDPGLIRDYAQAAEELGYSHILAYDHVLGAVHAGRQPPLTGPYTEETPFHEPLVLFGYLAGVTRTIGLMTGVLIVSQRQTALVAKQAAEVDLLSGGRLRLGIGTGWNYVEYDSLGMEFRKRGRMQEEQVEVLRRLWSEPVVDFSGRFHRIERAGIRPMRPGSIPIWFGGSSDAVLDRAARLGDGFVFSRLSSLATGGIQKIRERAAVAGRQLGDFGFEVQLPYAPGAEIWAQELERWREAGGSRASINTMGAGLRTPADHIDALRRYREVAAAFAGEPAS